MAKGKRRIRAWHIFVGLIFLCGVSGGVYEWAVVRSATRAIKEEVAKLQALGIATSPEEMPKPGPEDQNAALIYNEAFNLKRALNPKRPSPSMGGGPDPDYPAKLAKYIQECQPFMDIVRQAVALPDCNFRRQWAQGGSLLFPEFYDMKEFTKIAMDKAAMEASKGNFQESFVWSKVGRQVSVHVREPVLISYLVSVACEQIVLRELQLQIRLYYLNPAFIKLARKFCADKISLPFMRDSMAGEVMFVRSTMKDIATGRTKPQSMAGMADSELSISDGRLLFESLRIPSVRLHAEQYLLARYRKAIEIMPRTPGKFDEMRAALATLDQQNPNQGSVAEKVANIFTPVFVQADQSSVRLEASRRVTRQGLEIYAHKAATGVLPKAIDATKPWALDPFGGTLKYKLIAEGFELYSIGANKTDDGGPRSATSRSRSDDIVFFRPPTPPKASPKMKASP